MIAALDAHYDEAARAGSGAAVVFRHWDEAVPAAEYSATCSPIEPYEPGEWRGCSQTPLLVTAAGIEPAEAAAAIGRMAGEFRLPLLLKRADQLARCGAHR